MSCTYCQQLVSALPGNNYCSRHKQRLDAARSNAFYFKSKRLHSGLHQSRWAIRAVLKGYQQVESGGHSHSLHQGNYLITPQGADYQTEIRAEEDVEVIIVSFQPQFVQQALQQLSHSSSQQLDDPMRLPEELSSFWSTSYLRSNHIDQLLQFGKQMIFAKGNSENTLETFNYELLDMVVSNHLTERLREDLIPAKKPAVRRELFKRLRLACTFMSARLNERLSLSEIAAAVQLSPFHFLRLFKAVYHQSPMQYLASCRLQRARYLLQHAQEPIAGVAQEIGFEDQGAFARWFRRKTGQTPTAIRQL